MVMMRHCVLTALVVAGLLAGVAPAGTIFYADNFNRADSAALGVTSTGGYSWVQTGGSGTIFDILGNRLRLHSVPAHESRRAYVDYNLDAETTYRITYTFRQDANAGTEAASFILPRAEGTDLPGNVGWAIDTTGNNNPFHIRRYEGQARVSNAIAMGSLPAVMSNLSVNTDYEFDILVLGNTAHLRVDGVLRDTVSLGSRYDNGTPDRVLFGYNMTAGSGRNYTAFFDNLVVQVPEPSSAILAAAALGIFGLWRLRRRRR